MSIATSLSEKTIDIIDPETGQKINQLIGHNNLVRYMEFSPNSSILVSTSCNFDPEMHKGLDDLSESERKKFDKVVRRETREAYKRGEVPEHGIDFQFRGQVNSARNPISSQVLLWDIRVKSPISKHTANIEVRGMTWSRNSKRLALMGQSSNATILDLSR